MTRLAATSGVRHSDTPTADREVSRRVRCDDLTLHRWSYGADGNLVTSRCPTRSPSITTPVQPTTRERCCSDMLGRRRALYPV